MKRIFIAEAVRLPVGKFGGAFKDFMAQELGALAIEACVSRSGVDPNAIDEVIVGNILQHDPKGNPGREALLRAHLPIKVPAFTVNKNCGSSMRSVTLAASLIKAGEGNCYIAAGMETMSKAPFLLRKARFGYRMGDDVLSDALTDVLVGMGMTAERLAEKYSISREEQDAFAVESQKKAQKALDAGVFKGQIAPVTVKTRKGDVIVDTDEGVKGDASIEALGKLPTVFKKGGTVTAGNASTINDSAAALLVVDEETLTAQGLTPLAEIISYASTGCDPDIMGIGPVEATRKALDIAGLSLEQMDIIELNEAFAAQSLAVIKELGMDMTKVNPYGSGISLGHPVGATGAIITTKLAHALKDLGKTYGLATMCIGGGQGIAVILKNPSA